MLMNTPKAHLLSVHALKQDVPAFADALTLLRIWANQRGYGVGSQTCVRGFDAKGMWWASVLELLVYGEEPLSVGFGKSGSKRKPLGKGLSSYQLFKAALDFLGMYVSWLQREAMLNAVHGSKTQLCRRAGVC